MIGLMPNKILNIAINARKSARILSVSPLEQRNKALLEIANSIDKYKRKILKANQIDVQSAEKSKLNRVLLSRLKLNEEKITDMLNGINIVANLDDIIGKTLRTTELDTGLELYQITCSVGVIGIIFESRADALVQIASLCIKSGNSVIMKG